MKLDPITLALSFGGATVILWILCSALVAFLPAPSTAMTGHMLHADTSGFAWIMTWAGFLIGLICWTAWTMVAGWLVGWLYQLLAGHGRAEAPGRTIAMEPGGAKVIALVRL